ncbi:cytochrome P450 [Saccharothrix tamanrassetensis]|uniref:Cytochrome P450 n=1 Tax=Saccharothrix tamanrassetensis TaxID=1051531 RepID=A0A841CVT4_9PSEU|nr:cytochrome [Saccharothrix tamanrassetensis]MBB5960248.1 cytochrome P450 [Saccharothrix tamanrassetensis]
MAVASRLDTGRAFAKVLLPTLAKGVIVRRRSAMAMAEWTQADAAAVDTMTSLRDRYGPEPLRLRVTGRSVALVFDADDVARLLDGSPEPFALATTEKRAALNYFQPHGVLASRGEERERRRRFNEKALRPGNVDVGSVVRDEADLLVRHVTSTGVLTWDSFAQTWWRAVRRIVLGSGARADEALTDELKVLRQNANWAFLHPRRHGVRQRFERRLRDHLERGETGSLAAVATPDELVGQVPHWLFAFDAAGIVTMRALAIGGSGAAGVLESARLWPTTPVILRESTLATRWHGTWLPEKTTFVVFTPYFHRQFGDAYRPDLWPNSEPALVPFSGGPGVCPGRDLVLVSAGLMLDTLREHLDVPVLRPPLPATLNHFALRLPAARR